MKYLIDIDGILLNGSEPINNAVQFIFHLNQNSVPYLLMTNSIKSKEVQKQRLENAGINVSNEKILSPIVAINEYLLEKKMQRVKIIGSEAEIQQIKARNVNQNYEMVILLDFEKSNIGYKVIQELVKDIEWGIEIITASRSTYYLRDGGKAVDTGAFVNLLEEITNYKINNFGKPSINYFSIAGKLLEEEKNNIFVIGDDWKTDILGANEYGAKSILVKTGKYQENDEYRCAPYKLIDHLGEI